MAHFVKVAKIEDVKPGQVRAFAANGQRIVLANVEGTFFATQDLCTHDGGPLGEGELRGDEIECPRHGGRFNVKSGEVVALPPLIPIKTFPVKVQDSDVMVQVE